MRRLVGTLLVLVLLGSSTPTWADSSTTAGDVAAAAGSGFGTLIYVPLKVTFCALGGIAAGFTAIVSLPTAGKVAMGACGGSWIVTPNVVRGREPIKFVGETTSEHPAASR